MGADPLPHATCSELSPNTSSLVSTLSTSPRRSIRSTLYKSFLRTWPRNSRNTTRACMIPTKEGNKRVLYWFEEWVLRHALQMEGRVSVLGSVTIKMVEGYPRAREIGWKDIASIPLGSRYGRSRPAPVRCCASLHHTERSRCACKYTPQEGGTHRPFNIDFPRNECQKEKQTF
jgi:hypothetical protein